MEDIRPDLREALKRTAATLKAAGIHFALCGGYALWARGAPESEHDVDFLVAESDAEEARAAFAEARFVLLDAPEDWLFKVETEGVVVDILHRVGRKPADRVLLDEHIDFMEVLSVQMPVLESTEVVMSKLHALTDHFCNYSHLLPAVRALREQIDWDRLEEEVGENPYAAAFLYLTQRLGIWQGGHRTPSYPLAAASSRGSTRSE